jgi:hypothetical protein
MPTAEFCLPATTKDSFPRTNQEHTMPLKSFEFSASSFSDLVDFVDHILFDDFFPAFEENQCVPYSCPNIVNDYDVGIYPSDEEEDEGVVDKDEDSGYYEFRSLRSQNVLFTCPPKMDPEVYEI